MAPGKRGSRVRNKGEFDDDIALRHHDAAAGSGGHGNDAADSHQKARVRDVLKTALPQIHLPQAKPGMARFEGAHRAHHYSEEEWKKIKTFSSITYLPLHTKIYKHWLKSNWIHREWDHWLMMGIIGLSVGFVGASLKVCIERLAGSKFEHVQRLLDEGKVGVMWFVAVLISMTLAFCSAVIVVYGEPSAGGSGIPEVMAYLNGVSIRRIFGLKALVVKFFSCVFAVSGGLYGGQEGPMIHMGAALGKIMSQGITSAKIQKFFPRLTLFKRFRNMYDRRNFITAGAAAGVASAFTAPVGGLLFVLEEISSFWTHKLAWQTFFCCMVSTFTTQALLSIFRTGKLGSFSNAVFNIEEAINSQIMLFFPTLLVGMVGGLFAALFTWGNLKICKWRARNIVPYPWARIVEPMVVAFVTCTLAVLIPYLFQCMPSRCHEDPTLPGCNARYASSTVDVDIVQKYTCTGDNMYNPAATLFFTSADKTIEQLLTRNTHYQFDYGSLCALFIVYFSLCCYTAGMASALGTMVPALLIGACMGRLMGLTVTDIVGVRNSENWGWVDPGGFALIGAAAFFGGLTRLTFSLVVVMIEITDETHFLLPIMTAVMVGKWTADGLIESLYHNLIELKCFPFLSDEPHSDECLDLHSIGEVMATDVVTLPEIGTVAQIAAVLASNDHRAFPVVESTPTAGEVFKGIILRNHVFSILAKEALFLDDKHPLVLSKRPSLVLDDSGDGLTAAHIETLDVAEMVNLDDKFPLNIAAKTEEQRRALLERLREPEYERRFVTLAPYIDQSSYRIQPSFSLERGFNLFRAMGLSHIVVVDKDNHVVGLISRKDMTNMNIHRRFEALHNEEHDAEAAIPSARGRGGRQEDMVTSVSSGRGRRGTVATLTTSKSSHDLQLSHSQAIEHAGLDQGLELETM